jgi:hypothetical protein
MVGSLQLKTGHRVEAARRATAAQKMLAAVESAVKDLLEVLDVSLVFSKRVAVAALAG